MREIDFLIFFLFAAAAAWQDIRHRSVPAALFLIFAAIALITDIRPGRFPVCLYGSLAGFVLLVISRFTRGAIGSGDAWFFVVSGLFLPLSENLCLLALAVFLSGIYSLVIFMIRRLKNGRYPGKDTLPFLPFAAAAGLLIFAAALPLR